VLIGEIQKGTATESKSGSSVILSEKLLLGVTVTTVINF
jgi:hypothetical protein